MEDFRIVRQIAPFVTLVHSISVDADGIRWNLVSKLFGIAVRCVQVMALDWVEVREVGFGEHNGTFSARIAPIQVTRFIAPVSTRGPLRMRVAVDRDGAWMLPLTEPEVRRFVSACRSYMTPSEQIVT